MDIVYILFDNQHQYLGELFVENGKFSHLTLTPVGENLIGERFEEWQTLGIPLVQDSVYISLQDTHLTHDGRLLLRSPHFVEALRVWFATHEYLLLPMGLEALDCWEHVLALPLEPDEQYALAEDLSLVPLEELAAWKRTLQDAVEATKQVTI